MTGITVADVRALALTLPRTTEHLIRDRVKFRIKQIVYCAFSRDETLMGFAFPKEERAGLVAAEPAIYRLPDASDMRFNWVVARLAALDHDTMYERVCDAWAMCVPKFLVRERFGRDSSVEHGDAGPETPERPVAAVRALLNAWDPIGVVAHGPQDEYDCLIAPILDRLAAGAGPAEIELFLRSEIDHHFGLGSGRHDPAIETVARQVVGLRDGA